MEIHKMRKPHEIRRRQTPQPTSPYLCQWWQQSWWWQYRRQLWLWKITAGNEHSAGLRWKTTTSTKWILMREEFERVIRQLKPQFIPLLCVSSFFPLHWRLIAPSTHHLITHTARTSTEGYLVLIKFLLSRTVLLLTTDSNRNFGS